jgi:DNA-binding transcriptional ArsR family regulator
MSADPLSLTFSALADPTRRAILARLIEGGASVAELAQPFEMSVRAVSKHIRVLERAGLVTRERAAQRRPSRLHLTPLREVDDWLSTYRRLWQGRLDNVADVLTRIKKGELDDPRS